MALDRAQRFRLAVRTALVPRVPLVTVVPWVPKVPLVPLAERFETDLLPRIVSRQKF